MLYFKILRKCGPTILPTPMRSCITNLTLSSSWLRISTISYGIHVSVASKLILSLLVKGLNISVWRFPILLFCLAILVCLCHLGELLIWHVMCYFSHRKGLREPKCYSKWTITGLLQDTGTCEEVLTTACGDKGYI